MLTLFIALMLIHDNLLCSMILRNSLHMNKNKGQNGSFKDGWNRSKNEVDLGSHLTAYFLIYCVYQEMWPTYKYTHTGELMPANANTRRQMMQ
jgi:hypothetical protein